MLARLRRLTRFTRALLPPSRRFYSQNGEDRLLSRLFPSHSGFYVDVGAYDPTEFSNTRHFYDLGWTGINIDPIPARIDRFRRARPRDVNLNLGIGGSAGTRRLFELDPATLSTFDEAEAARCAAFPGHRIAAAHDVAVRPLREVLAEHAGARRIDFLSIDTEGLEDEVVRSNDWERFRPVALLIEYRRYHPQGQVGSAGGRWEPLLLESGYTFALANEVNALYLRSEDELLAEAIRRESPAFLRENPVTRV